MEDKSKENEKAKAKKTAKANEKVGKEVIGKEDRPDAQDELTPDTQDEPAKVLTVVIPYVKKFAQGNELRHAIASWAKYFRTNETVKIVVIGDKEKWMSNEVVVIPHKQTSDNPQVDVMEKLKLAIMSEEVSDEFVWTNDDIYLISPVMLSDINVFKSKGTLTPDKYNGIYKENMMRTIELLEDVPKHDYATHTPVFFMKKYWVELFESYPELNNGGYLLSSVYFNLGYPDFIPVQLDWKTDNWLLTVITPSPSEELFDELVAKKKFLNNAVTGYSEFLMDKLTAMFPEKTIYEE